MELWRKRGSGQECGRVCSFIAKVSRNQTVSVLRGARRHHLSLSLFLGGSFEKPWRGLNLKSPAPQKKRKSATGGVSPHRHHHLPSLNAVLRHQFDAWNRHATDAHPYQWCSPSFSPTPGHEIRWLVFGHAIYKGGERHGDGSHYWCSGVRGVVGAWRSSQTTVKLTIEQWVYKKRVWFRQWNVSKCKEGQSHVFVIRCYDWLMRGCSLIGHGEVMATCWPVGWFWWDITDEPSFFNQLIAHTHGMALKTS